MKTKLLFAALFTSMSLCAQVQQMPYQNKNLSPAERAEDLLQRLTLEEKLGLMEHTSKPVERLGIKPYTWWNETWHGVGRNGQFSLDLGVNEPMDTQALIKKLAGTEALSGEFKLLYGGTSDSDFLKNVSVVRP